MFTYLRGRLRCVRCGGESDAAIQTYLFRTDAKNCGCEYRVGNSEVMDGLDQFYPLYPWDGRVPLVLGVGDWDCARCSLNWQWARVGLEVTRRSETLTGTVTAVETLVPWEPASLTGIHRVEPDLAELSEFPASRRGDWRDWLAAWSAQPVAARCDAVARGFRAWCREVAGVSAPA